MTSVVLSVEGAVKNFGGVKALVNADLTLYAKEIHALLGENGAGKSTLLKILANRLQPDSGTISFQKGLRTFERLPSSAPSPTS
mgnify:CR=1 FL=1